MKNYLLYLLPLICFASQLHAEPNGAVLYRNGKRLGHSNVPGTAGHHYFGYLEGPAWENKYSTFRYYLDMDNRNAIDIVGKFKEEAILQHFTDTTVDEHADWPWGTDILKLNSSMGLGAFRLFNNNTWINPRLPENIDSLVVTILDSSVQTPKVQIGYHGWNIGGGNKITAIWTISTLLNERPTHCELAITGNYSGKIVVGMTNHKDNAANPNRNSIQLIQDTDKPLLATLGRQGGLQEGFADTLLMAIYTDKSCFDSFVNDGTVNYGMVLKPDAEQKVKWSFVYSWAREANPLFRNPDWKNTLHEITAISRNNLKRHQFNRNPNPLTRRQGELFSLSGRSLGTVTAATGGVELRQNGVYLIQYQNGRVIRNATITSSR